MSILTAPPVPLTAEDWLRVAEPIVRRVAGKWSVRAAGLDRDDLAQVCRLRIYKRFAFYDPSRGTPDAWICTVCESCCHDEYERCRRRPDVLVGDYGPIEEQAIRTTERGVGSPETGLWADDTRLLVGRLLGLLDSDQRMVVERYFGLDGGPPGETVASTADSLGLLECRCKKLFEGAMRTIAFHATGVDYADAL